MLSWSQLIFIIIIVLALVLLAIGVITYWIGQLNGMAIAIIDRWYEKREEHLDKMLAKGLSSSQLFN